MNKEGYNPYQAHEKRIAFIESVVAEGVLDKIPISERDQNIALVYYLEELPGEDVRKFFPKPSGELLTKARIYQISESVLKESRNYASPQLQAFHPLEELLVRKPSALGETASQAKSMVEKGINDPQQIKDALGISSNQLGKLRRTLEERDIDIPRTTKSTIKEAFERIENEDDYEELQEFLDSLPSNSLREFLRIDSGHKTLTPVAVIARKKGLWFNNGQVKYIAETIKTARVPGREIVRWDKNGKLLSSYYVAYIRGKYADRAAKVLRNHPDLQRFRNNPVQLAFGTFNGQLPATTELIHKKGYEFVGNLVAETLGIKIGGTKITSALFAGCKIPIFKYRHNLFFPLDQKTEFQVFLRKRHEELKSAGNPRPIEDIPVYL